MPSYAPYADVQVTTILHAHGTVSSVRSRQTFVARVALRSLHEREEGNKKPFDVYEMCGHENGRLLNFRGNLLAAGVLGDCFGAFTDSMLG